MNCKKKLCIILPVHWSYAMGGSEYQISLLLNHSNFRNFFDTYILSRRISEHFKNNCQYDLSLIVQPFYLQKYTHVFDSFHLYKKLKDINPDVIYQNVGTSYAGIACYYAKKYNKKMILHLSNDVLIQSIEKITNFKGILFQIEKKFYEYAIYRSSSIIAQTHCQKSIINNNYKKDVDAVVYNFHPYPEEKLNKCSPIKVVWVANFKPAKQPDIFIKLAEDLNEKNIYIRYIMIGRESFDIDWQAHLDERIERNIQLNYIGEQTNEAINSILADSHIFVSTSLYEGFANTFIQAWLRGLPVISLHANPDNLLCDNKIGFHCNGSYDLLLHNVKLLITNSQLREDMGDAARKYALEHFSMKNADKVIEIMKS